MFPYLSSKIMLFLKFILTSQKSLDFIVFKLVAVFVFQILLSYGLLLYFQQIFQLV